MIVTVTGKHLEITDAIRSHVEKKASKLPRYLNSVMQVSVIVEAVATSLFAVEAIVSVQHHEDVVAREQGSDLYACIDLVMHKLERQLHKIKEKQRDNKHPSASPRQTIKPAGSSFEQEEVA